MCVELDRSRRRKQYSKTDYHLGWVFKNQSACEDFQGGYTGRQKDAAVMDDTHTEIRQLAEERTR